MSLEHIEVGRIVEQDHQAFYDWVRNPSNKRSLALPHTTLRYFIPPRLYNLAADPNFNLLDDPGNIDVTISVSQAEALEFFILERKPNPLSDPNLLENYQRRLMLYARGILRSPPELPGDIDRLHNTHYEAIQQGIISVNDYITHFIHLEKRAPNELHVISYNDREELRGQGIAVSFYLERLHESAREMGFRYITGEHTVAEDPQRLIDFFTKRVGRILLSDLPRRVQRRFEKSYSETIYHAYFTVDFLDLRDQRRYKDAQPA